MKESCGYTSAANRCLSCICNHAKLLGEARPILDEALEALGYSGFAAFADLLVRAAPYGFGKSACLPSFPNHKSGSNRRSHSLTQYPLLHVFYHYNRQMLTIDLASVRGM